MALVRPSLSQVVAFDKNDGYVFQFTVTGGDQVVKNKLTIKDSETNLVAYEGTETTFKFNHNLSGINSLENGKVYVATINTYNIEGDISSDSNIVQFRCFTTPSLTWINKPIDNKTESPNILIEILYDQLEGELLDSVVVELYSATNELLSTSGKIFNATLPPTIINHSFLGLDDNTLYKIKITGTTVNSTIIDGGIYSIDVQYSSVKNFGVIELTNVCNGGYVKIDTSFFLIDGTSEPSPPIYIDNTYVDLSEDNTNVMWESGYEIEGDFTVGLWFKAVNDGRVLLFKNKEDTLRFELSILTDYVGADSSLKSYIELLVYENNILKVRKYSNTEEPVTNNSSCNVWLRYVDGQFVLQLNVLSRENLYIEWNGYSNVEYNKLSDIIWNDEQSRPTVPLVEIDDGFVLSKLTHTTLSNGVFDSIYITENTTSDFTTTKPSASSWDIETLLFCDFENSINGGNLDFLVSEISAVKINRRIKGEFEWTTIYWKEIKVAEDIYVDTLDSFVPSGYEFEYGIIPVLNDGSEGYAEIASVKTKFNGVFISSLDEIFKINSNTSFQLVQTQNVGVIQTIGSRVPFIVRNSNVNYITGSFNGTMFGYEYENTRRLNTNDAVEQNENFRTFLTNNDTKIIKDWLGNICMIEIVGEISVTPSMVAGAMNISFSFVEQGKYDDDDDLNEYSMIRMVNSS